MPVEPALFSAQTGDLALFPHQQRPAVQDTVPYRQALLGPLESLVWLTWGPLEVPLVTKTKRTRELQSGN